MFTAVHPEPELHTEDPAYENTNVNEWDALKENSTSNAGYMV